MNNVFAKIAYLFIKNKQLSLLLVVTIFATGILAFFVTPKQYNPEITLPAFRIITQYPGASAQEVESQVTNIIENKLYEVPGIDDTFSQSYNGGVSIVTVFFKIGESEEIAKTKVYEKLYSNFDLSPLGVGKPIIKQVNPENVAIVTLAVSSDEYSSEGLREFAFDLKEKLKTISGTTNLEVKGGKTKKLIIELSPEKLSAQGLNIQDIENVIKANNLSIPAGTIENKSQYIPVDISGNLNLQTLKKLQVNSSSDNPLYLEDIAEIFEGYDSTKSVVKYSTKEHSYANTVYIAVAKQKGRNGVVVSDDLKQKLKELKSSFIPKTINISIVRDEGNTAKKSINGLTSNLITSILIVTIVLILFLRLRAALIVALAIPLTLSLVVLAGFLLDKSINRITLFALILSLGLLVDSATVVVENVFRNLSDY